MKKLSLGLVLVAWMAILPAQQITREQADAIVKEHLQGEWVESNLLYINLNVPDAEGIALETSNAERFRAKYACWAYYLNESEFSQCRYLFVKEDDGNLLEVIASNDLGQSDLTQWKAMGDSVGVVEREENIPILYPNPTSGKLTIENEQLTIENVEVYDALGKLLQSTIVNQKSEITIDVSHLEKGIYFLRMDNKVAKIIKN